MLSDTRERSITRTQVYYCLYERATQLTILWMGFYNWHIFGITGDWSETESQLTGNPWTVRLENPTNPQSLSPSPDDSLLMKDRRQNSRPRMMVHTVPSFFGPSTAWCCPMTVNTRYTHGQWTRPESDTGYV